MSERLPRRRAFDRLLVALAVALAGCAAGPDFVPPAPPAQAHYTRSDPDVAGAGADAQAFRYGSAVAPQWWQAFGSAALDAVVAQALAANPTLDSARAAVAQADAVVAEARGGLYPQVTLAASAGRSGMPRGAAAAGNQFSAGPQASLNLDASGGVRRRVEQARALADYQRAQWQSARLALVGTAVMQAIGLAAVTEQIAAVHDIIDVDQRNVELVQVSETAGKSARLDVLTAQSQLANDRALLPPLEQQASAARHALALVVGAAPADWSPPAFTLAALALPRELPLSLPSQLVRGHPDIRAAEAQLHAANAAIGIATAGLYPSVALSASWSAEASTAGGLFNGASHPWSVASSLLAPLFNGGALAAGRDAAVAAYAAQLANYRQAVLQVFGRIADALAALPHDAAQTGAQEEALRTAQAALSLTQESYQAGQASLLQLLESQRLYQQARLGVARAQGQRFADTAQLFVALGGAAEPAPPRRQ